MSTADDLEKGKCFRHNNEVLKVTKRETIAVGTHSHSKLKFSVKSIFKMSGGEKQMILAHQDQVEMVDIVQKEGQLISVDGNKGQIMDSRSYETFDAEISEEALGNINAGDNVIFIDVEGKVYVTDKI